MNLTPEQQKERDQLLADMDALRQRVDKFCSTEVDTKPWPRVGDDYLYIEGTGRIAGVRWRNSTADNELFALGNIYRTEHRAYAERHVKAMQVQAELRRMPGVCQYSRIAWCISANLSGGFTFMYNASWITQSLGGVFFETREHVERALDKITTERLALFRDDYLQVPIGGDHA